jgi:TonB-dependent receptor
MAAVHRRALFRLMVGGSTIAFAVPALAQDPAAAAAPAAVDPTEPTEEQRPATANTSSAETPADVAGNEIVVTGIRASLRQSMDIKRNAQGVVDAISAEEMGKFPDTNLAESLQRITGVSIDRSNGEGSFVTVRGFGPEYNLVILNGRQMPTASLSNGGAEAPNSRAFDFGNLASEGIAAVEVYKSGRVTLPTGGIGSTINILTPRPLDRPGMRGSVAAKAVLDTSQNGHNDITPEFSGIFSDTFADDRVGILVAGSYQRRKSSTNQANVGWRDGYLGSENNWGSLPNNALQVNRPGPTDVYQVQQNASYDLNDIDRTRINGQAVLQFQPMDNLTGTLDFTYSQNKVETRNSNVGVWFNFGDVSSEWTDGPVAGPIFYSENFTPPDPGCTAPSPPPPNGCNIGKDLSYSGSLTANRTINKSFGGNLAWEGPAGLRLQFDAHHSTAESKPTNKFGSNMSVGNAVFGIINQNINYESDLPVINITMAPGVDELDPANITPTGNAFRTAFFKNRLDQAQLNGNWDFDGSFLDSIDFGMSYVDNKIRSAFGVLQNDTWGGAGPASDIPDDIFALETLPDKFPGISGHNDPAMIQSFYSFDFERMVDLIDSLYGTCSNPTPAGTPTGEGCLAVFSTDRRIKEKTLAPYLQANMAFDLFQRPSHLRAGVRYERTKIDSSALVPVPIGTQWAAANEFNLINGPSSAFTTLKGKYNEWLPAVDFDVEPIHNVKLRASYSHTITRADYASMQGGLTLDNLFRVGGGTGRQGNPALLPYKSKNIDLSAEWYYGRESYLSVGYFHKNVSNFISTTIVDQTAFGLRTPVGGPRYNAAIAAGAVTPEQIRAYIATNYPGSVVITPGGQVLIQSLPEDPLVNFEITTPTNSDQKAKIHGWEFNIQHSFWNTGFGAILNYTIVNGSAKFDNSLPSSVFQFALEGLSDSANAVLFYDKDGIQARLAYNWRDKFLASSGGGRNPFYTEAYGQLDGSASYEFRRGFTVFVEGINLTGSKRRGHLRHENNVTFVSPGFARYSAGMRVSFGGERAPPPPPPLAPLPPPPPTTQTCADGVVIPANDVCPAPPPPPPPPPPAPERG